VARQSLSFVPSGGLGYADEGMQPEKINTLVSRHEVEAAVRDYWKASTGKAPEKQAEWFAENAVIFATSSRRLEPGRLVSQRRKREYLTGATEMQVLIGSIEVELLDANHAVAVYTIQLDAQQVVKPSASGQKAAEEHLPNARVTHVFRRGRAGNLEILHEHISEPVHD
jgi:ketosteroid isomerase-like protein